MRQFGIVGAVCVLHCYYYCYYGYELGHDIGLCLREASDYFPVNDLAAELVHLQKSC